MRIYDDFVQKMWVSGHDERALSIATLGLLGESGEVAEKIKKRMRGDEAHNPQDPDEASQYGLGIAKELGDVVFYVTWLANYFGFSLDDVVNQNMAKLEDRLSRNGTVKGDGDDR